ncbi:pseudouridine synthase [Metamycoplasma canadense]|uniref:16S rRNA uridine-516 pseudouridylate synthase n=1 Tax=Metamycoplasma canadense TaxID=29554 RepID=A0A077LBM7_9BACT|nr:pseudouridine synthase [Metamycoplasma canadense]BAP39529.1 16S rRNA uridine-516 pseudouridylate synthase [Metamycoplasma canadense]
MKIRIEKIIANFLNISRNDCKKVLKEGRVSVNSQIITKPILVDYNADLIEIDFQKVDYKEKQYFIFNKPSGFITANFDNNYQTIFDIINLNPKNFFAYGRLDKDTEGLLIISNDGKLGHQIMNSKKDIAKKYYFEINKNFDDKIKNHYPKPILISNNYLVKKYKFEFITPNSGFLTIYEGKFHQIKEMLNFFNFEVTYLKRVSIGNLKLDKNLKIGEIKEVSYQEILQIINK